MKLRPRPSEHFDLEMKWLVIKDWDCGQNAFHLLKSSRLAEQSITHIDESEGSGLRSEAALSEFAKLPHQESLYPR